MAFVDVITRDFLFAGVNAPRFCWAAGAGLILLTAGCGLRLRTKVRRQCSIQAAIKAQIEKIAASNPVKPVGTQGLQGEVFEEIAQVFEGAATLKRAWAQLRKLTFKDSEDRYYAFASADTAFSEAAVVTPELNLDFYRSLPGMITGIGLLVTFLAILVALLGVNYNSERVTGLNTLISGLSGKFISSIAALFAASTYLFVEKHLLHRLEKSRLALAYTIDTVIPGRTVAAIMVDMHRHVSEQSTAFRQFNTDLSLKLKQSFSESVGPLQQRMVEVIEDLNQQLRAAEAQKQESISSNLSAVLGNLERSISATLNQMGDRFSDALSGSARGQFEELASSVTGVSKLLQQIGVQSRASQDALTEVITLARTTTTNQLAMGKTQVEELTSVLNRLMVQMTETAGSSVAGLSAALTAAISDMSGKVTELSERMSSTMAASTQRTAGAVHAVVEQAGTWTTKSAEQLNQLMERHQAFVGRVEDVSRFMDGVINQLKESLPQLMAVSKELRGASAEISNAASRTAQATAAMQTVQDAVAKTAGYSQTQVEALSQTARQIQDDMQQYQQVFQRIRAESGQVLTQIGQNLRSYTEVSRNGFEGILKSANEQMGTAVQRLSGSIEELDEYLQELNETLGRRIARG